MEKKRSVGVTVFGILLILGWLLYLPYLFDPNKAIAAFVKPVGAIFYVLSVPLAVLELVLAINILRLKEWARKYLVVLTYIYIVLTILMPFAENKEYKQAQLEQFRNTLEKSMPESTTGQAFYIYQIDSTAGRPILMRVDYALPEKEIANVSFYLAEKKPDGVYTYAMPSQEGVPVTAEFTIKNGALYQMRLDTPFRPPAEQYQTNTVFTLTSSEHKEILVTFSWNSDGSIELVNVAPRVAERILHTSADAQTMTPQQRQEMQRSIERMFLATSVIIKTIAYVMFLLFYGALIFFFTRPTVKEQFQ